MRLFILAAALAVATPAFAADFTGPRAEVRVGWDRVAIDVGNGANASNGRDDGVFYGAGLGYDFALGQNVVFGVEANADFSSVESCSPLFGNDQFCLDAGRDLEASARVGVVAKNALFYVKGGYANSRINSNYQNFAGTLPSFSGSNDIEGYRVGGGVEVALSARTFTKVEYRYTAYGNEDALGADVSFNRHQVVGAFGFRF